MRESFVIHAEYIEDLPEEYKTSFLEYVYNYGILEQAPILEGLEKALWIKIQRRIDGDIDAYSKRVEYQRAYYEKKKLEKSNSTFSTFTNIENIEKDNSSLQMFAPNSRRDIEFEFDNEFEFEYEFDIDNEFDASSLTPPQKNYSKALFELWQKNGMPGSKDEFSFLSKEFKLSIPKLKGLHSKDVLKACENYFSVLTDKTCYLTKKYCFDTFVNSKVFAEMLPDRFVKDNFKKFGVTATISNDDAVSKYDFNKVKYAEPNS